MKRYFNIFVWAVMCCMFLCVLPSCENKDEFEDFPLGGDWSTLTGDGSLISGISLKQLRTPNVSNIQGEDGSYVSDDYTNFRLQLKFCRKNIITYLEEAVPDESIDGVARKIIKYESGKYKFINDDFNQFEAKHPEIPIENVILFFFAYIDGGPAITCDKTLFGLEPGTNLSKYFCVCDIDWPRSIPFGIENPRLLYKSGDELPATMDKFFIDTSWVQVFYNLRFIEIPAEEYDELTFHVSFPMILEHTVDYAIDQYYGRRPERKFTRKTFESDCRVLFNRE